MATSTNIIFNGLLGNASIKRSCVLPFKAKLTLSSLYDKTLERMIFFPEFWFQCYTVQLYDSY